MCTIGIPYALEHACVYTVVSCVCTEGSQTQRMRIIISYKVVDVVVVFVDCVTALTSYRLAKADIPSARGARTHARTHTGLTQLAPNTHTHIDDDFGNSQPYITFTVVTVSCCCASVHKVLCVLCCVARGSTSPRSAKATNVVAVVVVVVCTMNNAALNLASHFCWLQPQTS